MSISDVLFDAIEAIEVYESNWPSRPPLVSPAVAKVKTIMAGYAMLFGTCPCPENQSWIDAMAKALDGLDVSDVIAALPTPAEYVARELTPPYV